MLVVIFIFMLLLLCFLCRCRFSAKEDLYKQDSMALRRYLYVILCALRVTEQFITSASADVSFPVSKETGNLADFNKKLILAFFAVFGQQNCEVC